jgi:hypothetical protein
MAKIFTPQVFNEISNLAAQGFSAAEIADKIGCTLNSLRVKCSQHGICLRRPSKIAPERRPQGRLTIKLSGDTATLLQQAAEKQGIPSAKFAALLLEAIVSDNLYAAVIDQDAVGRRMTKAVARGSLRTEVPGPPVVARRLDLVAKR